MVHPVVNAFTASEPGVLTKHLSEMNNFVSYDSERALSDHEAPHTESARRQPVQISHVTPETKARVMNSPESSLSTHSADPSPYRSRHFHAHAPASREYSDTRSSGQKRHHFQLVHGGNNGGSIVEIPKKRFLSTLSLRPEHYRAVAPKPRGETSNEDSYQYPPVPLTFNERKRLSDTLFLLSKEIPEE